MKNKILIMLAASSIVATMQSQQLVNLNSVPATDQDVVRSIPGSVGNLRRLGQLNAGTWADGWSTWISLGRPIVSTLGLTPNDQSLYGMTVNDTADRVFFGTRRFAKNKCNGVIAWGDDNWSNQQGDPDRFVFEFHDSNAGGGTTIRQAMTLMPNPANSGVFCGIGVYTPSEQLHTTQGVRFQGLTNGAINNLVGIDANGKLWRAPLTTGFGNLCSATSNPITGDFEMPLGNNRYYFTGQGGIGPNINQDAVGVGYACGSFLPARFSVLENQNGGPIPNETYAGHFKNGNNQTTNSFRISGGIYGEAKGAQQSASATPPINVGGVFEGYGTSASMGVCGRITKSSYPNVVANYPNARYAIGGAFMSDTAVTNSLLQVVNIGVYGRASNSPIANWAGYFDGDINVNGSGYVNQIWAWSDQRFKREIKKLENVSEKLKQISGYTYKMKTDEYVEKRFEKSEQIGVLAQEIQKVFPQIVKETSENHLAVNYQGLIPILIEAHNDQQAEIEKQNTLLSNQQKQIEELKLMVQHLASADVKPSKNISLSNMETIVLNQNIPNPFNESTIITFEIPTNSKNASILFSGSDGKILKTVEISEKGKGAINVFASELSKGLYTYSLIVDGKIIETKKMIKE